MKKHRGRASGGYRSKFEHRGASRLLAAGFLYEARALPYQLKPKTYTPDWVHPTRNLVIEFKGYFPAVDRAKMLAVKLAHPSLDIRFVFANAGERIAKRSTTTYGEWATKHGFVWAHQTTPAMWLHPELFS